jgi:hypothetical protein
LKSDESCISNPKSQIGLPELGSTVQLKISDFGLEMQDSSNFKISSISLQEVALPPLALQLQQVSPLFNFDPPGAPLPLGRTQYDAGRVLMAGQVIGEYLRVKDVHAVSFNVAAVTITLFFPAATPAPITLQGAHTFDSGNEAGSISASSVAGITGIPFFYDGATRVLTIMFP